MGSPVSSAGQLQTAWWLATLQRALLPQDVVDDEQGSVHWLLMQARLLGQLELDLQPRTQVAHLVNKAVLVIKANILTEFSITDLALGALSMSEVA